MTFNFRKYCKSRKYLLIATISILFAFLFMVSSVFAAASGSSVAPSNTALNSASNPIGNECTTDSDCGAPKECSDGTTVYYEHKCHNGVCEPVMFSGGSPCIKEGVMPPVNTPTPPNITPPEIIPPDDGCPEGFLLHEGICKPKIINLMAPEESDYYLSNFLSTTITYNWKESPSLIQKANELTQGMTNDLDKVKAIANWVKKSKNYNLQRPFHTSIEEVFNDPEGICNEAAVITVSMLRSVGIDAIPAGEPGHVFTAFRLNGSHNWNSVDSTFCYDKNQCPDVTIVTDLLVDGETGEKINSVYYTTDSRSQQINSESGKYCDNFGFCLNYTFLSSKAVLGQSDAPTGSIFYPSVIIFESGRADRKGQTKCELLPQVMCDAMHGCIKSPNNYYPLLNMFPVSIQIGEQSIGYNKLVLPKNNYKYRCINTFSGYIVAYKEFNLRAGDVVKVTYNNLTKGENATDEEFAYIQNRIKSLTADLGIVPDENTPTANHPQENSVPPTIASPPTSAPNSRPSSSNSAAPSTSNAGESTDNLGEIRRNTTGNSDNSSPSINATPDSPRNKEKENSKENGFGFRIKSFFRRLFGG